MILERWLKELRREQERLEYFILNTNIDNFTDYKKSQGKLEGVRKALRIYEEILQKTKDHE